MPDLTDPSTLIAASARMRVEADGEEGAPLSPRTATIAIRVFLS